MGRISETTRSQDGIIRRVDIEYHDLEGTLQTTDRSVRSVVKLFNLEDGFWRADMDAVARYTEQMDLAIPNKDDFRHKGDTGIDYNFTGESTTRSDMDISAAPFSQAHQAQTDLATFNKGEPNSRDNINKAYSLTGESTTRSFMNISAAPISQEDPATPYEEGLNHVSDIDTTHSLTECGTCCCEAHHRFCLTTTRAA